MIKNIEFNHWLTGFIDGEGSFHVAINKNSSMKLKVQVLLEFSITQHKRDLILLQQIKDYLNSGYIIEDKSNILQYRIRSLDQLEQNLFPLLVNSPLKTQKALDFFAFKQVHSLMKNKEHLTLEGLQKIIEIKNTMNRKRIIKP